MTHFIKQNITESIIKHKAIMADPVIKSEGSNRPLMEQGVLNRIPSNIASRFVEADAMKLIHCLEMQQSALIQQNKELIIANSISKQMELDLIKAKEKSEESDRLKSAFLANMSHEIRTPMNGILGFTELLKKPELSVEKQQTYISMIEKGGERMLNIINSLIDISKIESGQTNVNIGACNINEQIEYIYTFFKPEVEAKGMQLFIQKGLPTNAAVIQTDGKKILAILTNLVKNAIKYSDKGAIEFGYYLNKAGESIEMAFFVTDTGRGIPQDKLEVIFDRFFQVNKDCSRSVQGAGLGLAIAKAYVEMLDGKIWVESEVGKGSTFNFTIPYHIQPGVSTLAKNIFPYEGAGGKNKKVMDDKFNLFS